MSIRSAERALAARLPASATLARWALGGVLVAAGVHKFVDPGAWTVYVVDPVEPVVGSPLRFVLLNAVFEVVVGLALFVDRSASLAALVAAVSLTGGVVYFAAVWGTTGRFGAAMVRDFGLAGLAWAVFAATARGEGITPPGG